MRAKILAIVVAFASVGLVGVDAAEESETTATAPRPPVKCTEDSPERRGQEGCTVLVSRPLNGSLAQPLYWHIDRFDSPEAAQKAAGRDSVVTEAHGGVWLLTVEGQSGRHHRHPGGRHVTWIGPLVLPAAEGYTMRVQSTLLLPGATTPVHIHSGPEVFYIVDGEQCLETRDAGHRIRANDSLIVPTDTVHRGRVTAPGGRRALVLVLHDAARPGSQDLVDPPALVACN